MFIYLITNTVNGKKYVGKTERTVEERWREHCRDCVRAPHLAPLLYRAMHKHGIAAFRIDILESNCNYNLTLGGTGGKPNEATLMKLRKPKSEAHKAKCSLAAKRRGIAHMLTPEARNRKGLKMRLRVFTEETRLKMSLAAQKRAAANPAHLEQARTARRPQIHDAAGKFSSHMEGR